MPQYKKLFEILSSMKNAKEMDLLLHELLTSKELEDIWRRWQVLEDIHKKIPQRDIAQKYKMSLCKITRGSKVLKKDGSICKRILEKKSKK